MNRNRKRQSSERWFSYLFYWDKEKATTLLRKARVAMPKSSVQIHSGYIASICDADSTVKPKMKNVTESVQFKRWFGNWIENPEKASKTCL